MVLSWDSPASALASILATAEADPQTFLDVLDFLVHSQDSLGSAERLEDILAQGGSLWRVTRYESGFGLERRVEAAITNAVQNTVGSAGRAGQFLALAWREIYGRDPNPSAAYREAVRAVEAAAQPVLLPANNRATLGQMIAALRDSTEKWRLSLSPTDVDPVQVLLGMIQLLWKGQHDRHGDTDTSRPLQVSPEEAEAAVHLAATLVHWFTSGAVQRV
jgi:hypothetical protein